MTTRASRVSRSARLLFLFVVSPLVLSGCTQLLCDFGVSDLCEETYTVTDVYSWSSIVSDQYGEPILNGDSNLNDGKLDTAVIIGGGEEVYGECYDGGVQELNATTCDGDIPVIITITFSAPSSFNAVKIVTDWHSKRPATGDVHVVDASSGTSTFIGRLSIPDGGGNDCGDGISTFGGQPCSVSNGIGFPIITELGIVNAIRFVIEIDSLHSTWFAMIKEIEFS